MSIFSRSQRTTPSAPQRATTPPPPGSPIEVGLVLRARRERLGLTLEQARDATGVPALDLEALERAQLGLLHVEQAAVVGIWRYAEFLGLDPGLLVPVIRSHWPHPALAVDAVRPDAGAAGTPVAQLTVASDILTRIEARPRELAGAPTASDASRPTAPGLGLSTTTRAELERGAAGAVLTMAVIGPAPGHHFSSHAAVPGPPQAAGALGPGAPVDDGPAEPPSSPGGGVVPDAASVDPPVGEAAPSPREISVDRRPEAGGTALSAEPVPDPSVGEVRSDRSRRWSSQLAHTVAERFGLDGDGDGDGDESTLGATATPGLVVDELPTS